MHSTGHYSNEPPKYPHELAIVDGKTFLNNTIRAKAAVFPCSVTTKSFFAVYVSSLWVFLMLGCDVEIVDVAASKRYGQLLYRCLAPMPFRKYQRRREYLEAVVPRGFHKKVLFFNGEPVGQIEYAPSEAAGYPITGTDIIVMNCIWVLRKAKGHRFGTLLLREMMESERDASGFATIGLEDHWSPWLRKSQMEKLGFRSIDSIRVSHKTKHVGEPFTVHLMWLPRRSDAEPPTWDKNKLLEGEYFCIAHPIHHPQNYKPKDILQAL